jgi:hypothetical protein
MRQFPCDYPLLLAAEDGRLLEMVEREDLSLDPPAMALVAVPRNFSFSKDHGYSDKPVEVRVRSSSDFWVPDCL